MNGARRKGRAAKVLILFLVLFVGFVLPSCSPRIVERIVVQRDTTIVHHRDSLVTRDSIYIREWMKGDTVYIEKYKDRFVYRDRWRDSISVKEVHDTTTVEKLVEKELSWVQETKIGLFPWLLLAVIGLLAWAFRKPILKLIK